MNELMNLVLGVQPATLALLAAGGYALDRRIRGLENRTITMEAKLDLLLEGHTMKGTPNGPAAYVGTAPGTPGA